jgi:hypothetical protein
LQSLCCPPPPLADDNKYKKLRERIQSLEKSACPAAEIPVECKQDFMLLNAQLSSLQAKELRLRAEMLSNPANAKKTEVEVEAELQKFIKGFETALKRYTPR